MMRFYSVIYWHEQEILIMKKKKTPAERAQECIRAYRSAGENTDVNGSYTGTVRTPYGMGIPVYYPCSCDFDADDLRPVQDADDL